MPGFLMTSKEGRLELRGRYLWEMEMSSFAGRRGWGGVVGVPEKYRAAVGPFLRAGGGRGREAPVGGQELELELQRLELAWLCLGEGNLPSFPWEQRGSRNHILKMGKWLQSL